MSKEKRILLGARGFLHLKTLASYSVDRGESKIDYFGRRRAEFKCPSQPRPCGWYGAVPREGAGDTASRSMCVAESSDGVNFQVVGPAITFAAGGTETDPSLVSLLDGSWLMAVSRGQQTIMTRSSDGLSFSAYGTLGYGGVPELARLSDGRVRLYVCAAGIESYVSNDAGRSWQRETTVVPAGTLGKRIVCDPSMVSGTDVFIFKTGS